MLSPWGSVRQLWQTTCSCSCHNILVCRNKINIVDEIPGVFFLMADLMTFYPGGKSFEAWCLANPPSASYLGSCTQGYLSGIRGPNFQSNVSFLLLGTRRPSGRNRSCRTPGPPWTPRTQWSVHSRHACEFCAHIQMGFIVICFP